MRSKNLKTTLLFVTLLTLISKLMGFFRDVVMSHYYGASEITDAFSVSITIPNFILNFIFQIVAICLVPIFTRILIDDGKDKADKFISHFTNLIIIISFVFTITVMVLPEIFLDLLAPGFDEETKRYAKVLIELSALTIVFQSLIVIMTTYNQANRKYFSAAMIGLPLDIAVITLVIISFKTNVYWILGLTMPIVVVIQLAILVPGIVNSKFRYNFGLDLKNEYMKEVLKIGGLLLLSTFFNLSSITVSKSLLSNYVGAISSLEYALKINSVIESVLVVSFVTVLYTEFSRLFTEGKKTELKKLYYNSLISVTYFIIPAAIGLIILSDPIISLVYGHGAFNQENLVLTSNSLKYYSLGMIFVSISLSVTPSAYPQNTCHQ